MNVLVALSLVCLFIAVVFAVLYLRERQHRLRLVVELARVSDDISKSLIRDDLTGLLSRSGFDAALDKATRRVDTAGGAFCVLYVALDDFGLLNDAFGRLTGDRLLQSVSQRLAACSGMDAELSRVNSGEFAFSVGGT